MAVRADHIGGRHRSRFYKPVPIKIGVGIGVLILLAVMIWQAVAFAGAPNPTAGKLSPLAMAMSSAVLVLREGLEAILVLAALTAGMVRNKREHWRAVAVGTGAGMLATIATWFVVVAAISAVNAPELDIQAGTGLLAVVVLLVVMNWFFHKVYWTGWICHHCKRKKALDLVDPDSRKVFWGFLLLGFTAIYREGFEVVLILQDLRLKAGSQIVLGGAAAGLLLTAIVAGLIFIAHQRLPYKKMLVLTGGLLSVVLIVMVGESAQEMQLAGWLPTTQLALPIPDWIGTWFATFPTVEGLASQAIAASLVFGSYWYLTTRARRVSVTAETCPAPQAAE